MASCISTSKSKEEAITTDLIMDEVQSKLVDEVKFLNKTDSWGAWFPKKSQKPHQFKQETGSSDYRNTLNNNEQTLAWSKNYQFWISRTFTEIHF